MQKKKSRTIRGSDIYRYLSCTAAVSALSVIGVYAFEASDILVYSHGPLSLRPQIAIAEEFNDNVYYANTQRRSDLITGISPGLKFQIGENLSDQNHFTLLYMMDKSIYVDNPSLDALQHRIRADAHYATSRIGLDGLDLYESLSSVLGGGFNIGKQKVGRNVWLDRYRFDYKFGERIGIYLQLEHNETDFRTDLPLFDTRTISGTAGFQYAFSENTFFFGETYYGQTSLNPNSPGTTKPPGTSFTGGFLGARGDFTEKINGSIKVGYEVSTFSIEPGSGVDTAAGSSPVVEASVSYAPTDRLSTSLSFSRRQQVSIQFVRSSYAVDTVSASVSEVIGSTRRLRLDLSGTYALYSFDPASPYPAGRTDSNFKIETGANYFFQTWLYTRMEYSFERFASDFASVVDYNVNRITLSVAVGY